MTPRPFDRIVAPFRALTIRRKLAIGTLLLLGTVAAFLLVYVPGQVSRQALRQMSQGAEAVAEITAYSLVPGVLFGDEEAIASVIDGAQRDVDIRYMVVEDANGRLLAGVNLDFAERVGYRRTDERDPLVDGSLLKTAESIRHDDEVLGTVYLGHSLDSVYASVAESRRNLALVIGLVFVFAFAGILFMASVLTRPLGRIMRAAEDITAGDLARRSGIQSEDEVGRFARAFDGMVGRLEMAQNELQSLNRGLEDRVAVRTAELNAALSETVEAEREAKRSEHRFRAIFDSAAVGIALCDADLRVLEVNRAFEAMWGGERDRIVGMNGLDLVDVEGHPTLAADFAEVLAGTRRTVEAELRARSLGGDELWVRGVVSSLRDADGSEPLLIAMVQDVTEHRTLSEQLRQSQKLEAVGRLAGGVAHDFNNLLTVINGLSDLMLESLPDDAPLRGDLMEIKKAGDRAATLTQQLLAFSRRQPQKARVLDVSATIGEMSALLRRLIGEHITLDLDLAPSLPSVKADPGQIGQVIMNLAVNSRDAMPRGGRLRVESSSSELGEESAAQLGMAAGRAVQFSVTDTGSGMDAETLAHVFEPFFTTKEPGKGTGLGLATVYGIVKQSGGGLAVESELGKGTTFSIWLPATNEDVGEAQVVEQKAVQAGQEAILVVEDEPAVRELTARVLRRRGYETVACATPGEAINALSMHPNRFDAVVSDIVMPEMSGPEMARRLATIRPGIPVLFLSGYPRDDRETFGGGDVEVDFLQKPVAPQDLTNAVREMLDRAHSRS